MPGLSGCTPSQQCYLLSLLLGNLEKVDESNLLRSLEQVWESGGHKLKSALEARFDGCCEALRIWIDSRRKTNELRSLVQRRSSAQTLDSVDRALALNEIRILRLQWEALWATVDNQGGSPEDLLCRALAIMIGQSVIEAVLEDALRRCTCACCRCISFGPFSYILPSWQDFIADRESKTYQLII